MAIEKINFSYPKGTLQSVFDNEALTALELAAKTSKKVDECVEVVNAVEQTAIEATAIVDDMYVIQNQFVTDNSDTRAQLINDNQEYLNGLTASKEQFENDLNASKEQFESDLNASKEQFESDLNASKEQFESDLNASKEQFESDLNASKEQFETDMSNEINTIIENSENLINSEVTTKIETMANDGSLADVIDQQIFTEIRDNITDISINVKNFGAVGDGITDDTIAIKNAITYAETLINSTLFFPHSEGYLVTDSLLISSKINVDMKSPILFDIDDNTPGLIIGGDESVFSKKYVLNVKKTTISDWINENSIGIKLINFNQCDVTIVGTQNFTIGLQCMGSGGGFAYNKIYLQLLYNNYIDLDLTNETQNGIGWCNENTFYGGRFSVQSTVQTDKSRYGIRITSKDLSYLNNNNNMFFKPSFELGKNHTSGEAIPLLLEHANGNQFIGIRHENNSPTVARINNDSADNIIDVGYGNTSTTIEDNSMYPTNVLNSPRWLKHNQPRKTLYLLNDLYNNSCDYSEKNPNFTFVKGLSCKRSSNSLTYNVYQGIKRIDNYIEIPSTLALGVFIDTSRVKEFILSGKRLTGNTGRPICIAYKNNIQVTENDGSIKGISNTKPYFQSAFGGHYTTGSDISYDFYIKVASDVDKIWLGFKGHTNNCRLQSFSITYIHSTMTPNIINDYISDYLKAENAPLYTFHKLGTIIYNSAPDIDEPLGWVCIEEGTPGTWASIGTVTAITPIEP